MRERPGRPRRPGGPRQRARPGTPAPGSGSRPAPRRPGAGGSGSGGPSGPGGTARSAARRGGTTRTSAPRPPGRLTGRAVILGVVLVALALSYVFPLRVYFAQQAEISQLRAAQREQQARVEALAEQAALWADEDYIRIQARKRLYYGEPGEVLLVVLPSDDPEPGPGADPDEAPGPAGPPWWDTLWRSVQSTGGQPPAGAGAG